MNLAQIEALLDAIPDPEIPVISIRELGILRDIRFTAGALEIVITPTYSGCPAMGQIEDDIRDCERCKAFGTVFINLARSVYLNNDRRAALKRTLNVITGSDLIEEKSYQEYG